MKLKKSSTKLNLDKVQCPNDVGNDVSGRRQEPVV